MDNRRLPTKYGSSTDGSTSTCPFTREQVENYRSRIGVAANTSIDQDQSYISEAHNVVYQEILTKLPACTNDSDSNVLTMSEKQIVKDELEKVSRGKTHLDGDGDTSLSMIHMIF